MKICIVTSVYPPLDLGGVAEVTYNLQRRLCELGVEAYVITRGAGEGGRENNIVRIPSKKEFFVINSLLSFKKLKLPDFDLVHFHDIGGVGILPYCKDTKKILTLHTSLINMRNATCKLDINGRIIRPGPQEILSKYIKLPIQILGTSLLCRNSNIITSVSEKTRKQCSNDYHVPEDKIRVIHNGVDTDRFNPDESGNEIREKYNIGAIPLVLYVGRLRILKGIYHLLYAMKSVCKHSNAKLLIAGWGEAEQSMHLLIQELGLGRNVVFAGKFQNRDLPKFYAAADVVVVPSIYEGFSLVALEAMACGKPVVVSSGCGISDSIIHGKNGLLFGAGNVEQLIENMLLLLENPVLREEMGRRGRRTVEEKFDCRNIAIQYKKEYEKLIKLKV